MTRLAARVHYCSGLPTEAPKRISVYGQEKDNATHALARMNMILA